MMTMYDDDDDDETDALTKPSVMSNQTKRPVLTFSDTLEKRVIVMITSKFPKNPTVPIDT